LTADLHVTPFISDECSNEIPTKKARCGWCNQPFRQKPGGRPALFCKPACRQRAYEKRKWTPFSGTDAMALDLLPAPAMRRLEARVRHQHMVELLKSGGVPLADPAQIDGVLDSLAKPQDRRRLLDQIEGSCRKRADDVALSTIARWRMQRQNR
jgi:hypothetical protein